MGLKTPDGLVQLYKDILCHNGDTDTYSPTLNDDGSEIAIVNEGYVYFNQLMAVSYLLGMIEARPPVPAADGSDTLWLFTIENTYGGTVISELLQGTESAVQKYVADHVKGLLRRHGG